MPLLLVVSMGGPYLYNNTRVGSWSEVFFGARELVVSYCRRAVVNVMRID